MGHLLGTGLLDADEESRRRRELLGTATCQRLRAPDLVDGNDPGNWPLGYHGGSVWPHDTAMTIEGLFKTGHEVTREATSYLCGLMRAAETFGYRLPELYGGLGRGGGEQKTPTPYPFACRPQAWAAGTAVAVLVAALGIAPDVTAGKLTVKPTRVLPWSATWRSAACRSGRVGRALR